jgi:hypothetical protein
MERPIIFNTEMIKAILDGRKTTTRRPMKIQPPSEGWELSFRDDKRHEEKLHWVLTENEYSIKEHDGRFFKPPYGYVGDKLWVRETWALSGMNRVEYKASPADGKHFRSISKWKPSIHMPRWASRITLEITGVSIEQLHNIDNYCAVKEGMIRHDFSTNTRNAFINAWDRIYKESYPWASNPWVWVIDFKVLIKGGE